MHFANVQLEELLDLHRYEHCANGFEHFTDSFTDRKTRYEHLQMGSQS